MNHPNWCQGGCGKGGVVCSDRTYLSGYCLEPKVKELALKREEIKKETEETTTYESVLKFLLS